MGVVFLIHLVAASVTGTSLGFVALLAPLVATMLVYRCALLAALDSWQSVAVAVLALGCPLAVAASESPGAGLTAMIALTAVVVLIATTARGRHLLDRGALVGLLTLAPLTVGLLTELPWALGHGWGTGATRLDSGVRALTSWPGIDPVLPWLAGTAALGLLAVRGRRTLGAAAIVVTAVVAVADLRVATLVAALPLAALVVVVAAGAAWSALRGPGRPRAVFAGALVVAVAVIAPAWALSVRALPAAGAETPAGVAGRWLAHQVPAGERVGVDADLYEQLVDDADPAQGLVPLSDGAAPARAERVRWIVASPALRQAARPGTWARRALSASKSVTVFGSGSERLDVRALTSPVPAGRAAPGPSALPSNPTSPSSPSTPSSTATPPGQTATSAPSEAALELADNTDLVLSDTARTVLTTQPVDDRLVALLAQIAGSTGLSVVDFPLVAGDSPDVPHRQAVIAAIGGRQVGSAPSSVASLRVVLAAQAPEFRPAADLEGSGSGQLLVITLPAMGTVAP